MKISRYCILAVTLLMTAVSANLYAAPDSAKKSGNGQKAQTVVTADRMSYEDKLNMLFFEENVKVTHPGYTMTARKMTVQLKPKGKGKDIEKVTAVGDVVFINKLDTNGKKIDREAKAKEAVFYRDEGKVILTGDVTVRDGENNLWGKKITIWIYENRMECEPSRIVIENTEGLSPDKH